MAELYFIIRTNYPSFDFRFQSNFQVPDQRKKTHRPETHGALHLILRHLSVPPEVIDLLLFLHTCARLRIVTAQGLTQPVHMLRGLWQGNPESPLLYALLLEPLLRAQGHRLRSPGEAERGLIQPYIDDLLVVAKTIKHFVEGVGAVAAYLGMMDMDLNPPKCAMATTEGVPGLQLRLCPNLENPGHWVPAADSVPYLGLELQPNGGFSLQRKHRLRLAAVHHWCLNTLAPPKVVQDRILAILGVPTQYVAPFITDDSNTARHLDHITVQVAKDRARYAFDAACRMTGPWDSRECQRGANRQQWPFWAHSSTTAPPPCTPRSPGCFGKSPARTEYAPRCPPLSRNSQPWWGATGCTAYPGPWPPYEWGSTAPSRGPGRPASNYNPHRAASSRCALPSYDTATRAA